MGEKWPHKIQEDKKAQKKEASKAGMWHLHECHTPHDLVLLCYASQKTRQGNDKARQETTENDRFKAENDNRVTGHPLQLCTETLLALVCPEYEKQFL
ncbi:hypothetical protein R1flu_016990 [Riccia fluitans]|uniref:Uncharacterized protein n=1 Tax=Riccia fluitans TaxID=41844 RepID=A0ABD1YRH0_9MARC